MTFAPFLPLIFLGIIIFLIVVLSKKIQKRNMPGATGEAFEITSSELGREKKSIGVTLFGWYFILQGIVALGYLGELGALAILFFILFLSIGIGLLKRLNSARIATIVLSIVAGLTFCYFKILNLSLEPQTFFVLLAILVFSGIFLLPVFYFTRPRVKGQFLINDGLKEAGVIEVSKETGYSHHQNSKVRPYNKPENLDSIHKAAETGDIVEVNNYLEKGVSVNAKDKDGATPLHWAACSGFAEIAELLIDAGADVNATNKEGTSVLPWAILNARTEVAELLIDAGADVDVITGGRSMLHWAIAGEQPEIAELLIESGADVNLKSEDGTTPLHWAVISGQDEIVELLIDNGANINTRNTFGLSIMDVAIKTGNDRIINLLKDHGAEE